MLLLTPEAKSLSDDSRWVQRLNYSPTEWELSCILLQQEAVFELQSPSQPPTDDPASAPPARPPSSLHIPTFPSQLEMKPTGKQTVLSVAMQE